MVGGLCDCDDAGGDVNTRKVIEAAEALRGWHYYMRVGGLPDKLWALCDALDAPEDESHALTPMEEFIKERAEAAGAAARVAVSRTVLGAISVTADTTEATRRAWVDSLAAHWALGGRTRLEAVECAARAHLAALDAQRGGAK